MDKTAKLVIYRNVLGNKNIRYLDELEKELENIYETLIGDAKKKEAFRKNLLDWVKKYVEYLKNGKKKVI